MDRNTKTVALEDPESDVALRKESVDRNYPPVEPVKICVKSLSVRRAWIEIQTFDIDKKLRDRRSP